MVAKNWKDQMNGCASVSSRSRMESYLTFPSLPFDWQGNWESRSPAQQYSNKRYQRAAAPLRPSTQLTQTVVKLYRRDVIQSRSMPVTVRMILPYGKR
jgi:hypothetical protein